MTRPNRQSRTIDAGLPVRAFFTTRHQGLSVAPFDSFNLARHVGDDPEVVDANRARLDGLAGTRVLYMSQEHGNHVTLVTVPNEAPTADAMVTLVPSVALAVLVADCVPVLLHDATTGAVAAVHAGREGVAKGVVPRAVEVLSGLGGGGTRGIRASIGPAICGGCYEVPAAMRDEVATIEPAAWAETTWLSPSLDLRGAVRAQLEAVGVGDIRTVGSCTRESTDQFSHRRDGVTGRFAGVICCEAGALYGARVAPGSGGQTRLR